MIEQKFGPRRCRDTRKPLAGQCPDVVFIRCSVCEGLFVMTGMEQGGQQEVFCCGEKATVLDPITAETAAPMIEIDYQITGGYNDNAVRVSWKGVAGSPIWIYLKTFTGGYLKYVTKEKRPPMVFALADTDAFAYCDEDPCLECVFRCKRGFIIYVYTNETGLIEIPLDRMTAHWQTGAK